MPDYKQHSRFIYGNREDVLTQLEEGNLDTWDMVICKDTHELDLIKDDHELLPIQSKVYLFDDVASAESTLNENSDTYAGQIVSILNNGKYTGYIVNGEKGNFKVAHITEFESADDSEIESLFF